MPSRSKLSHPARPKLSHFSKSGQAAMVDVGAKHPTRRTATASAFIELSAAVLAALPSNPKGDPLEVAPERLDCGSMEIAPSCCCK